MAAFVRQLRWEEWNIGHIGRHRVSQMEVAEVCQGEFVAFEAKQGRILLVGPTLSDRLLAVVLAPEGEGVYYPVTARPASKKECRLYQEKRG